MRLVLDKFHPLPMTFVSFCSFRFTRSFDFNLYMASGSGLKFCYQLESPGELLKLWYPEHVPHQCNQSWWVGCRYVRCLTPQVILLGSRVWEPVLGNLATPCAPSIITITSVANAGSQAPPCTTRRTCGVTEFQMIPRQVQVWEALPNCQVTGWTSLLSLRTVVLNHSSTLKSPGV